MPSNIAAAAVPPGVNPTALSTHKSQQWFAWFATGVLLWNIPVILWGAYVRASFSGDGCGAHWPFCNGQVIPQNMHTPTIIEFTHRMMTSVDSIAVIGMCVWAFWIYPKRHAVRLYSVLSVVFLLIEALLGAGLVVFRLVAKDQSAGRAVYLSAHLTNTLLLLGVLTLTAWLARTGTARFTWARVSGRMFTALAITAAVSVTGAVAALGDTLFPATSLASGMQQDFTGASNGLLRLRTLHPVFAVCGAAYILWALIGLLKRREGRVSTAAIRVLVLVLFQLALGAANLTLLAPIWMQMLHLLVADMVWVSLVALVAVTASSEFPCQNL